SIEKTRSPSTTWGAAALRARAARRRARLSGDRLPRAVSVEESPGPVDAVAGPSVLSGPSPDGPLVPVPAPAVSAPRARLSARGRPARVAPRAAGRRGPVRAS